MLQLKTLLDIAAVLFACACVIVWLRHRIQDAEAQRQSGTEPRGASAILPDIERLRAKGFQFAHPHPGNTPAHRWLLVTTRRAVARSAYFQTERAKAEPVGGSSR